MVSSNVTNIADFVIKVLLNKIILKPLWNTYNYSHN